MSSIAGPLSRLQKIGLKHGSKAGEDVRSRTYKFRIQGSGSIGFRI